MLSFQAEIKEVIGCVKLGRSSDILDGQLAQDAIKLCQKQTESLLKRRIVRL